jgi:hypothetical protein
MFLMCVTYGIYYINIQFLLTLNITHHATVASSIICTVHLISLDDHIKEDVMGGACSTHGGMRNAYRMLHENLKEETTWKS